MATLTQESITGEELFEKLQHVKISNTVCQYNREKCEELVPLINEINHLKKEKNAVILAHAYVTPDIIFGVADFNGDSYGLSKDAANTDAETIIFSAVKFMAETAKILNPEKNVLIPGALNGCSLADSITGNDVKQLKRENPEFTFVCYINTSADVKAECDVCVTSSNVYKIVENLPTDKIFFLPDKLMGKNLIEVLEKKGITKTIKLWDGVCYVHEEYDPEMIEYLRLEHPSIKVLSHPECSPEVVHQSDFVGSTTQMVDYVKNSVEETFFMLTECGLTSKLQVELPHKKFVGACTQCKYMKDNNLENILSALKDPKPHQIINLSPSIIGSAKKCIDAMFEWAEK